MSAYALELGDNYVDYKLFILRPRESFCLSHSGWRPFAKSGHRMAAKRWNGGTISMNLGVILEMSDKLAALDPGAD